MSAAPQPRSTCLHVWHAGLRPGTSRPPQAGLPLTRSGCALDRRHHRRRAAAALPTAGLRRSGTSAPLRQLPASATHRAVGGRGPGRRQRRGHGHGRGRGVRRGRVRATRAAAAHCARARPAAARNAGAARGYLPRAAGDAAIRPWWGEKLLRLTPLLRRPLLALHPRPQPSPFNPQPSPSN